MRSFIRLLILLVVFTSIQGSYGQDDFDREKEFPNFFKELVREDTLHAEYKLAEVLQSVVQRLQVPYVVDGEIRSTGFFKQLNEVVHREDPGAKVFLAGGVVRSLLGYLYQKVYYAKQKNPKLTTEQILDQMISSKKDVISLKALGIGSDMDFLIEPSPGKMSHVEVTKRKAAAFINSAEKHFNLRDLKSKLKYNMVPIADVKLYDEQMSRTTKQGGSTLDWFAFPLDNVKNPQLKKAERAPHAFQDFILGKYDYLPPQPGDPSPVSDKQVVRGIRPMLEIPFLALSPSGEAQIIREMKVVQPGILSHDATEQFGKMMRNARFGGAHNRVYRSKGELAENILALVQKQAHAPHIPEFIRIENPNTRKIADTTIDHLLMDPAEFREKHTHNGILYHGTKTLDGMMAIVRSGFVASIPRNEKTGISQGLAAQGQGAYTSKNKSFALSYGIPIELVLRSDVKPRILDLDEQAKDPELAKAMEHAKTIGVDPNKYISEKFQIDIIYKSYPLLQNSAIVRLPKNIGDLINSHDAQLEAARSAFLEVLRNRKTKQRLWYPESSKLNDVIESYSTSQLFHKMAEMAGIQNIKVLQPLEKEIEDFAIDDVTMPSSEGPIKESFDLLGLLQNSSPAVLVALRTFALHQNADNRDYQAAAIRALGNIGSPQAKRVILELLPLDLRKNPEISEALEKLEFETKDCELLASELSRPKWDRGLESAILTALDSSKEPLSETSLRAVATYFSDPNKSDRYYGGGISNSEKAALHILSKSSQLSREIQSELLKQLGSAPKELWEFLATKLPLDPKVGENVCRLYIRSKNSEISVNDKDSLEKFMPLLLDSDPRLVKTIASSFNDLKYGFLNMLNLLRGRKVSDPETFQTLKDSLDSKEFYYPQYLTFAHLDLSSPKSQAEIHKIYEAAKTAYLQDPSDFNKRVLIASGIARLKISPQDPKHDETVHLILDALGHEIPEHQISSLDNVFKAFPTLRLRSDEHVKRLTHFLKKENLSNGDGYYCTKAAQLLLIIDPQNIKAREHLSSEIPAIKYHTSGTSIFLTLMEYDPEFPQLDELLQQTLTLDKVAKYPSFWRQYEEHLQKMKTENPSSYERWRKFLKTHHSLLILKPSQDGNKSSCEDSNSNSAQASIKACGAFAENILDLMRQIK